MIYLHSLLIIVVVLHGEVLGDGYPKENPAGKEEPQEKGSSTEAPVAAAPAAPPTSYYGDLLASGLYSGLYPPVSTDYASRYYGPTAVPVVLPDGHIADTAAVAAARAAHLAALERAKALWFGAGAGGRDDGSYDPYKNGDYAYNYNYLGGYYGFPGYLQGPLNRPYFGPLATPTVLPSGYLADSAATAAARAAHLAALVRARADAALWRAKYYRGWN